MEENGGIAQLVAETHAGNYYRRSGLNAITVRDKPGVKRQTGIHKVHEWDLELDDIVELIVHPELRIRKDPWTFWGQVTQLLPHVVLRQISGREANTFITLPHRYFQDGRVYRTEGYNE